ncbi:unnamed protein product [Gongylonema pulchrum]|uniref:Cation_ATPase_N domain-containing protein n=1 Tax=Gongylonema pulchrum TaxID=637853 RepID=A0A183DDJ9_9BILA|nr:unnamed protein product [Gongylonema pulchrum]
MQQAEMTRLQPKTGNKLIDMLHENGIPIGNSLKGLEQAIKTQREIENTDPAQQARSLTSYQCAEGFCASVTLN